MRRRSNRAWSPWAGEYDAVHGVLRALLESHHSVDVVAEWQIQDRLSDWPVIVLPELLELTDEFKHALTGYVKDGGNLVLCGASSVAMFPELIGAKVEAASEVDAFLPRGHEIAQVRGEWAKLIPTEARVLLHRYPTRDTRDSHQTDEPAAVVNRVGRGSVLSIPGPVGSNFAATHYYVLRNILGDLVAEVFPNPIVKVQGPPCVDVAVRRSAAGALTIHLANMVALPRADHAPVIDYLPAVGPITLRISTAKPSRVLWHPGGTELDWQSSAEGGIEVTISSLAIHGVVEIVT